MKPEYNTNSPHSSEYIKKTKKKKIQFHTPAEVCPTSEKIAPGVHSETSAWDSNMLKMIS